MKLYEIVKELERSERYVFSTEDLARVIGSNTNVAAVYAHRMKSAGMIFPVEKGKFALGEDAFILASQVTQPSYLSFTTAFYLHGRMDQVIDHIYVSTSRKKSRLKFSGIGIDFVKLKKNLMFGYRKHRKGNSYILLADLEKAAVDSLYLPRYATVSTVYEALSEGFDRELLEDYARRMESEAVIRRAGYLIELLGERTALKPSSKTIYRLNPLMKSRGKYVPKWRIYVNEVLA